MRLLILASLMHPDEPRERSQRVKHGCDGLEGSVRYWPTVATTLSGGERAFAAPGGSTDVHQAYDLPVITNVSVGWRL